VEAINSTAIPIAAGRYIGILAFPKRGRPQHSRMDQIFQVFSVPADGTGLPNFKRSGDFGTSPLYGQLPGQASSSLPCVLIWRAALPSTMRNSRKLTMSNFIQTRVQHES
jgi:hypothetical protein